MDWINGFLNATKFLVGDSPIGIAFNYILGFFKNFLLVLLNSTIIPLLNNVMSYQNFFSDGVNAGWTIARDFSNLFFGLVLLLIAISTVLNVGALDNYTAKRMLPKFIFIALFINFSKAIVGFFIDISQIIMISFYNSFGPNLGNMIGNASKIAEAGAEANTENIAINLFTIIIIAILVFVLLWTALILTMRIVTLWFVIMLSPLAFMASLVPALGSISSDWNKKLQEALVTGPTLMFLLYLAFAVMNAGISSAPSGGNLMTNGNLLTYVLVICLLFLANSQAIQAGQSAPPILKNAVGVAGTIATLGIGAKVGAGGYGTRQMFKKGVELGDKGIGGATRGVQIASGGKINPNDRYEMWKEQNKSNVEKGKAFGGGWLGGVAQQTLGGEAGRKANFEKTQLKVAEEARLSGKLDSSNPALQKALANAEASTLEKYKSEEDTDTIVSEIKKAVKKGDYSTARALTTHLNSLGEINQLFKEDSLFEEAKKIAEEYATEADQLEVFNRDILKSGSDQKYDKSFRVRNRNIAKSKKGMEGFGVTPSKDPLPKVQNDPTTSDLFIEYQKGSISENAKKFSDNLFSIRETDPATGKFAFDPNDKSSKYKFSTDAFKTFVSGRSLSELENPDTWKSMNQSLKTTIINGLIASVPITGLKKDDPNDPVAAAWRGIDPNKPSGSSKVTTSTSP